MTAVEVISTQGCRQIRTSPLAEIPEAMILAATGRFSRTVDSAVPTADWCSEFSATTVGVHKHTIKDCPECDCNHAPISAHSVLDSIDAEIVDGNASSFSPSVLRSSAVTPFCIQFTVCDESSVADAAANLSGTKPSGLLPAEFGESVSVISGNPSAPFSTVCCSGFQLRLSDPFPVSICRDHNPRHSSSQRLHDFGR